MRLSRSACHALRAVVEMARGEQPVTVAELAARHALPEGALAKVLQALVRAHIVHGTRGVGGGYRLAREPAQINVLEVVDVFDPPPPADVLANGAAAGDDRLRQLFDEVEGTARTALGAVTFATLAR